MEAAGVDLDHGGAQAADALPRRVGAVLEGPDRVRVGVGGRALGRRGEREREAGQVLDRPVVQVGRDPPPLDRGRLERRLQQRLALAQAVAQAAGGGPRQGQLDQPQQQQRADDDRRHRDQDALAAGVDGALAPVDLEERRAPLGGADGQVHLQQRAVVALEDVLRLGEVAQLGVGHPGLQGLALVRAERVAAADQPGLVRVDDAPVGVPDLDPHDVLAEDALLHDAVEPARERPASPRARRR